jgi:cell division protein FtsW
MSAAILRLSQRLIPSRPEPSAAQGAAGAATPCAGDAVLFAAVAMLLVVGLVAVTSSSAAIALQRFGTPHHLALRHAIHLAIGAAAMALLWRLDYRKLDRSAVVHAAWACVLVLLVVTLFQPPIGGARRWIHVGTWSLQPSELAKLAVVLVAAFQLARRQDRLGDAWKGLLPPVLLVAQLSFLVALQPDFGTAAILLLLFGLLAFVAGTPLPALAGLVGLGATTLAVYLVQEPYRLTRLRTFMDPGADPLGAGFQLRQSLIAVGSGGILGRSHDGLFGTGLGCSVQKLFFLPEAHTDFVLAVLGEELGVVGALFVVGLFVVILVRGLRIARRASDTFGALVATGAVAMLAVQALVNAAVVVGLVPTKGLPLPFVSAGGSSLLVSCSAAGLLLSVSRHAG